VVPSKLSRVPPQTARLQWPRNTVGLGDTMLTGDMEDRPTLSWTTEPGALYTIVVSDESIPAGILPEGTDYIHWLVTNIPGTNAVEGTEVMRYLEPFIANQADGTHQFLVLVFRQPNGRIRLEETQRGCSPSLFTNRALNKHHTFVDKYGLQLVAGTWFRTGWGGRASEQMLCYASKCNRAPFPFPLAGVNDGPECQPSTEVVDLTLRGPKLARLADYGARLSLQNPGSLADIIVKSKVDGISTGTLKETEAYFGQFLNTRPTATGNLATTLEGQVNPALLTYQSREGASRLFSALGDPTPIFETFAGDAPLHIAFR